MDWITIAGYLLIGPIGLIVAGLWRVSSTTEQRVAGGFGSLDSTPAVIVTHGRPFVGAQAFLEEGWFEAQQRLAALSSDSRLLVAEHSGHGILFDEPELVVEIVQKLVAETENPGFA